MQIELHLQGTPDVLRGALAVLREQLGADGQVMADDVDEQHDDVMFRVVTVAVFGATSEVEALERIQPCVRAVESDGHVVVGGTTVMQLVVPS
jgi:hypothetical protein